jgi:dsRNA-specific ribonuclease
MLLSNQYFSRRLLRRFIALDVSLADVANAHGVIKKQIKECEKNVLKSKSDFETDDFTIPKYVANMNESIAGAVLIDSNMDFTAVWRVFKPDLDLRILCKSPKFCEWMERVGLTLHKESTHSNSHLLLMDTEVDPSFPPNLPINQLEDVLGHCFRDPSLLASTIVHPSWSQSGHRFRRLRNLGHVCLKFFLLRSMMSSFPDMTPDLLTTIRASIFNNRALTIRMLQKFESAGFPVETFLHASEKMIQEIFSWKAKYRNLTAPNARPPTDEASVVSLLAASRESPTCLLDMFEAMVGAIYWDCDMDATRVWKILKDELVVAWSVDQNGAYIPVLISAAQGADMNNLVATTAAKQSILGYEFKNQKLLNEIVSQGQSTFHSLAMFQMLQLSHYRFLGSHVLELCGAKALLEKHPSTPAVALSKYISLATSGLALIPEATHELTEIFGSSTMENTKITPDLVAGVMYVDSDFQVNEVMRIFEPRFQKVFQSMTIQLTQQDFATDPPTDSSQSPNAAPTEVPPHILRASKTHENPISEIVRFGQAKRMAVRFQVEGPFGEKHDPRFFVVCRVGADVKTQGEGSSKQAAKSAAAILAIEAIKNVN